MELAKIIAGFFAGYLLACHLIAKRRKCGTAQVVRDALTIQGASMRSRDDRHCPA